MMATGSASLMSRPVASMLSLALALVAATHCVAFAPSPVFTLSGKAPALRLNSGRAGFSTPKMSMVAPAQGMVAADVAGKAEAASHQLVQASVMLADIFDDIGTDGFIYGGLAVTVISIIVMLVILYQDGVR
mmetsp:Transcript_14805/g.34727  ORF Transcript_14805/g.34727 Transcript_14805/m.34727 type:complete len:132 (-) Transcript_14805:91-486(-)